jgi:hypothetical protein
MRFDTVFSFDIDAAEGLKTLCEDVQKMYPDYKITIVPDVDASLS